MELDRGGNLVWLQFAHKSLTQLSIDMVATADRGMVHQYTFYTMLCSYHTVRP